MLGLPGGDRGKMAHSLLHRSSRVGTACGDRRRGRMATGSIAQRHPDQQHEPGRVGRGAVYGQRIAQFYGYTVETGLWRALAPLPFARDALRIVAGSDGRLYAIGGSTGHTTAYANVEAYDPHTNTWTAVASSPFPRNAPAAVSAPDGRIYVAAGQKDFAYPGDEFTATTFTYRPGDPSWTTLTAPGLFGRYNATGMLLRDGRMLVAGGFNAWASPPIGHSGPNLSSAQTFNPASSAWTSVASMLQPRQAPADGAVGCDGRAYVAGGVAGPANDVATNTVEQFDPLARRVVVRSITAIDPRGRWHGARPWRAALSHRGPKPNKNIAAVLSLDTRPTARTWCGAATGFERGVLADWATARNVRVVTGEAYNGASGAQLSSTGLGGAYARLTLPALQDRIFYRAWFRPTLQEARPVTLLQLRTLLGAMISVQRLPSGQLSLAQRADRQAPHQQLHARSRHVAPD